MKKKEVLEIKKQFFIHNCNITRIIGRIIDEDKEHIAEMKETFLSLPEEMLFKFLDMFQKALSGKIRKNLYSLEFQEDSVEKDFLKFVRDGRLCEPTGYKVLFERIREQYDTKGRFAIFLIHGVYDIPGKAKDETEMHDASEEVYEYIMTCICPVSISTPALAIEIGDNQIKTATRQWIIGKTDTAFMYPAFTDRSEDYDHVWFYTRKPNEPAEDIIENVLGCELPETPEKQKEAFLKMTKTDDETTYEMDEIKRIYQDLQVLSINADLSGEGITRQQLESVLRIAHSEENAEVVLQNIIDLKSFNVLMADASISVAADRTDLIEMREIEGEQYICVRANGTVMANGMELGNGKTDKEEKAEENQ